MDGCGTGNGEAYPIRKQMYQSSNKRIIKNTLLLYVRMLFLVLISLYTSRIVLQTLGIEDYGINNVVAGIISFLGFLTGSLSGASSIRKYYRHPLIICRSHIDTWRDYRLMVCIHSTQHPP